MPTALARMDRALLSTLISRLFKATGNTASCLKVSAGPVCYGHLPAVDGLFRAGLPVHAGDECKSKTLPVHHAL